MISVCGSRPAGQLPNLLLFVDFDPFVVLVNKLVDCFDRTFDTFSVLVIQRPIVGAHLAGRFYRLPSVGKLFGVKGHVFVGELFCFW